ncbi:hypothetical protein GHT06_003866 [Daphnia sinensis]|uniref:Uncharacterized protein n=1 Tax=Daphnia sinensis TaxID=1820382 RepID=A0AAD5KUC1_9CRUS|nr:hypothetical protein GHT06_003866 [Daphnia sinensis]
MSSLVYLLRADGCPYYPHQVYFVGVHETRFEGPRLEEVVARHNAGLGSTWTRRFSGWELRDVFRREDQSDANDRATRLMYRHGLCRARGGQWAEDALSPEDVCEIVRRVAATYRHLCPRCGFALANHPRPDVCTAVQYAAWVRQSWGGSAFVAGDVPC